MTWKKAVKDYSAEVLATQSAALAGYWPLNEAPGATVGANLKVGANPTGTFGANWAFVSGQGLDGVQRNCLYNTGSGTQVAATIASYNGQTCSIMAWVKPTVASLSDSAAHVAFGPYVDASNNQYPRKASTNSFQAVDTSTSTVVANSGSNNTAANYADTGWMCWIALYTPTTVQLFVNGTAVAAATTRSAAFTGSATQVLFSITGANWLGYMADCAFWTGVNLTTAEIANLSRRGY